MTLIAGPVLAPVAVGVWDNGVDPRAFPGPQGGVFGASGFGSYPLSTVRSALLAANSKLSSAQNVVAQARAVMEQRNLTPDEFATYQQATSAIAQAMLKVQDFGTEPGTRQQGMQKTERSGDNGLTSAFLRHSSFVIRHSSFVIHQ